MIEKIQNQNQFMCAGCLDLKQKLSAMQEAAVVRQVALDMELKMKWKAVKYISDDELLESLRDRSGKMSDDTLRDAKLYKLVKKIVTAADYAQFLADLNVGNDDEYNELVENLRAMKEAFNSTDHPKTTTSEKISSTRPLVLRCVDALFEA